MSLFVPWRCWFEYQFLCYFGNGDSWTQDPSGALFSFPADLSLLESWWGSGSWIASPRKAPLCSFIFNKGGKRERCCRWHGTRTHYRITHIVTVYIPDYNIQKTFPKDQGAKEKAVMTSKMCISRESPGISWICGCGTWGLSTRWSPCFGRCCCWHWLCCWASETSGVTFGQFVGTLCL